MTVNPPVWPAILGRFSFLDLPWVKAVNDPSLSNLIGAFAAALVPICAVIIIALFFRYRVWKPLWTNWLTSVDHKNIGIMYVVVALVMLLRAIIEGVLMRLQQAAAIENPGIVTSNHFEQLFSTHGTIMIFLMAMPFLTGIINYTVPLQIGARDMAFPWLNSVAVWLTIGAAMLLMLSLVVGQFSTGGWTGYPPYTENAFTPNEGPDYWIWALTLGSISSTMAGINIACTIWKLRAPGMTYMRMPLNCWTSLCIAILMIFAMPALTVATADLALDRYLGFHFFTNDRGGNMMNFANLFWLFGHPEVYILLLPAFGVYSEVVSTFSSKELYGYVSLVSATMAIAILSFTVWVHHFFTMGQSATLNSVFGIATMTIGIPTGVKIYDWIWTMFRGEIRFTVPMLYSIAFMVLFVIGGFTGIMLAMPPIDFMTHNTVFLVAHFHNMVIPGVLFGMLAGYTYWFPKAFGFRLNEVWGRIACCCFVVGFFLAFEPLYILGLGGMARRTHEIFEPAFRPWLYVAGVGALIILCALGSLVIQLAVSIINRDQTRAPAGDPWDAGGLEWSVSSPPPEYNFWVIPTVRDRDTFAGDKKHHTLPMDPSKITDIVVPRNSMAGLAMGVSMTVAAFGLVWHMWWLVIVSLVVTFFSLVGRSFARNTERVIPAREVRASYDRWREEVRKAQPISREAETTSANRGLAAAKA